jgi:putative ABC transport system permease protein
VPARGFSRFYNKVSVEGMPATEQPAEANGYAVLTVDTDFLDVYAIPVVAGRNFSKDLTTDATAAILNQQAAQQLGFTQAGQAIGQQLRIGQRTFTITGVIKNYHHDYLKNQFSPVILRLDPSRTEFFSLKVNTGTDPGNQLADALSTIRQQWKQIYPGNPFDYFFLDEAFNEQYLTDQQLGSIIASFASLAIFVAYLGLFGLASFTTARRTKEIGVRKVLGANQVNILILLNKDLIKLIGVANIIAWPLAWWGMHKWLDNYAFPIALSPWLFILPSLLVLIIALLTVSLQTLKAARTNPVDALRSE